MEKADIEGFGGALVGSVARRIAAGADPDDLAADMSRQLAISRAMLARWLARREGERSKETPTEHP